MSIFAPISFEKRKSVPRVRHGKEKKGMTWSVRVEVWCWLSLTGLYYKTRFDSKSCVISPILCFRINLFANT